MSDEVIVFRVYKNGKSQIYGHWEMPQYNLPKLIFSIDLALRRLDMGYHVLFALISGADKVELFKTTRCTLEDLTGGKDGKSSDTDGYRD